MLTKGTQCDNLEPDMKTIEWNGEKSERLKKDRGISFEDVVVCMANEFILDVVEHPNQDKYSGQKMFVILKDDYAYLVPFVETEEKIYLKTIIPSRKATQKYLKGKKI